MQLPRVVIAAVFVVIAALLAIPALMKSDGAESRASTSASTSPSPSTSGTSGSATPTSSGTPKPPARPVTASIGSVSCPERTVHVKVRNTGTQTEDFSIERDDGGAAIPGKIQPNNTRTVSVKLREDRRTDLTVTWANKQIEAKTVKANCKKAGAGAPTETPPSNLPHTGPDTVLWARAATGAGILLTGAIIFWYGGIWPRRREKMFAGKESD
jgi:hypothetical protein